MFANFLKICFFLQFYADSQHMHCDTKHTVFGIIGTCNLLHPQSTSTLFRQSEEYIPVCLQNKKKWERQCQYASKLLYLWTKYHLI